MRVTVNRAELLDAAKQAASIAPGSSPLKEMTGTLLETDAAGKLVITATNLETSLERKIPCAIQDDGALVIKARLLATMLEKLPGDMVELHRKGSSPRVRLQSGDAEYAVPVFERSSFPKPSLPFPEDTVKVSGIPSMAKRTVFASERDGNGTRPLLKCVNLMFTKDGLRAASSNGTCVVTASGDNTSTGNINLLIPATSLDKLARMCGDKDEFRVGTTGKTVAFLREDFIYSARLMEGEYIDIERLTGSVQPQFRALTDVADLRNGLDAVLSVDPDGKVGLFFNGDQLAFRSMSAFGSSTASIQVIPLLGISQGSFWYQAPQLTACFRALSGTVKLGVAQGGMLMLETEDALYLQTAVRAPTVKAEAEKRTPARKAA